MTMNVIDLFCGTGGFSHGFAQTGEFNVLLGLDIRQQSVDTFAANHRSAIGICDDIRNVKLETLAERIGGAPVDVIIAGPPCQGFSSIRPFRSINENDPRNTLYEQVLVFVDFFKPKFLVFENVVGMLHHDRGRTISAVAQSFEALGYSVGVEALNSVCFGVPQKRERVIVLGRRGEIPPYFPAPKHRFNGRSMAAAKHATKSFPLFSQDLPPAITVADAIFDLPPVGAGEGATEYCPNPSGSDYANARRKGCDVLTLHSSTGHRPRMLDIIRQAGKNRWALPAGLTTSGFSSCYSRLSADEPSTTITVNFVHPASNRCIHPIQDRALTPREGARLQSFDDDFVFCGSRTQIVKQIGEAVPPLLGRAIAEALLQQ